MTVIIMLCSPIKRAVITSIMTLFCLKRNFKRIIYLSILLILKKDLRKNTGIVQDAVTAVDIDDERTALVLVSLTPDGNICTERTYYAMICEIDATACKVTFHVTDDVA